MNKRNLLNYRNAITVLLLAGLSGCSYWQQPAAPVESGNPAVLPSGNSPSANGSSSNVETSPVETGATVKPVEPTQQQSSSAVSNKGATTHVVQPGENLYRVSLTHGLKYQDVAQWNNLPDFNIKVGQVLRLTPPGSSTAIAVNNDSATSQSTGQTAATAKTTTNTTETASTGSTDTTDISVQKGDSPPRENGIVWAWPTEGSVIQGFSTNNKGLDIAGKTGQPIYAAASGTVAYSGSGLRGYGKLIIIKHDKTFLSAYAHNSVLLVTEGKTVKKGQKIAEMGNTDADRVKLHFEIRRFGKPVDPAKYLK